MLVQETIGKESGCSWHNFKENVVDHESQRKLVVHKYFTEKMISQETVAHRNLVFMKIFSSTILNNLSNRSTTF